MKRRVKKVYKKLPPHTYEAHPVASAGEASKPLIIAIITIVAIILLSALLLFSKSFVGKAISAGVTEASAELNSAKVYTNQPFSMNISANIGADSTKSIAFTLKLPPEISCDKVTINNLLNGWSNFVKPEVACSLGKITFFRATTDDSNFKKGAFNIAQIIVSGAAKKDGYLFDIESLAAYDLKDSEKNLISTIKDITVNIVDAACGDGIVQTPNTNNQMEACDDGNTVSNDGCSSACMIESGFACTGQPSACQKQVQQVQVVCGNGMKEEGEVCDGADLGGATCVSINQGFSSGTLSCAADCKSYNTAMCTKQVQQVCMPNQWICEGTTAKKQCNADGIGYNAPMICDPQQICSDGACVPEQVLVSCGNVVLDPGEQCDDGNPMNGDGCSSACMTESGYICAGMPSVCQKQLQQVCTPKQYECESSTARKQCNADGTGYIYAKDFPTMYCDQGQICNDGVCAQQQAICGNGIKESPEECDDGNVVNGDGCSSTCMTEVPPPPPIPAVCGNGDKESPEECDDGNVVNGDGCSSTCMTEQIQQVCMPNQYACEGTTAKKQCKADGSGYNEPVLCAEGQVCSAGVCGLAPVSVTGKKITLTDIATANNVFATKITATETFINEVTVYTILYGLNDKVLSIKSEKLEAGLTKDETYTATVNYPEANVKKKSVLVYDVEQNPSVFGQLQVPKS